MIRLCVLGDVARLHSENLFQPGCGISVAQVVANASGGRKHRDRTVKTVLAITYTTLRIACYPAIAHAPAVTAESEAFVIVIASSGSDKATHRVGLAAEAIAQLRQSH